MCFLDDLDHSHQEQQVTLGNSFAFSGHVDELERGVRSGVNDRVQFGEDPRKIS